MIFKSDRSPEERHHAVAHHLADNTARKLDRIPHHVEDGLEQEPRIVGIEILDQASRSLNVGKDDRDGLALAGDRRLPTRGEPRLVDAWSAFLLLSILARVVVQGAAALNAETPARLDLDGAPRALGPELHPAGQAEAGSRRVVGCAGRAGLRRWRQHQRRRARASDQGPRRSARTGSWRYRSPLSLRRDFRLRTST